MDTHDRQAADVSALARVVGRSFGDRTILDGVDLEVRAGEVFALLGPNGAGKTTLVGILSTLLTPDSGSARQLGFEVVRQVAAVRSQIAAPRVDQGDQTGRRLGAFAPPGADPLWRPPLRPRFPGDGRPTAPSIF